MATNRLINTVIANKNLTGYIWKCMSNNYQLIKNLGIGVNKFISNALKKKSGVLTG